MKKLPILFYCLVFAVSALPAAELTFNPPNPQVEIGGKITLSVSGTSGAVTWSAIKGQITDTGTQVTYWAPDQVGLGVVSVLDEAGNTGIVKIVILPKGTAAPSQENASWEVFTNRSRVSAFVVSEDEKTLWVSTDGGLEQRDRATGELVRVFTNLDGVLCGDSSGGLWIGTKDGLAYRSVAGEWTVYNTENSGLPDNSIKALYGDSSGGLWIGTYEGGLAYRSVAGEWTVYNTENSGLPSNRISALYGDSSGGLWIGTWGGGLVYCSVAGEWTVYNTQNSGLPRNWIYALYGDSSGGLWILTPYVFYHSVALTYRSVAGEWTVYNTQDSGLPFNSINALYGDSSGGLWIGTERGLAYSSVGGEWTVYNTENSGLPFNGISALYGDSSGGLWIGTNKGGLAYRSVAGEWTVYSTENSGLPSNRISALYGDSSGGLWIGMWHDYNGGLVYRSSAGELTVYNTENSGLPFNSIYALYGDSNGGLWIGTHGLAYRSVAGEWTVYMPDNNISILYGDSSGGLWIGTWGGLAYRSVAGEWTVYNTDNSGLPDKSISALYGDSNGGLWIGTYSNGLAYRSVAGEWTVYNTDNSGLPSNEIQDLYGDSSGGLWIGTYRGGLAYRSIAGEWTVYNTDNSGLPYNSIISLYGDSSGGLWIGTYNKGLSYRSVDGKYTVYNTDNSGLPNNSIKVMYSDSSGGLWIGGYNGGLAHLTFSKKNTLCAADLTEEQCQNILTSNRAAIIIAGGGSDDTNTLWNSTAYISSYIYKMLNKRGFDNDEIYYLSPNSNADFNGDGLDDCIVDAPATPRCRLKAVANPISERALTVDDVRKAFAWAKTGGKLDQPLYVFFVDHGKSDKFQLSKNGYLGVDEFKTILDDYQNETGNEVALVIEACYSGTLLSKLKAPNRAIISSTGDDLAYFDRMSHSAFSRYFAKGLWKGMSFWEAFEFARDKHTKYVQSVDQVQNPQWTDGTEDGQWLRELFINGNFTIADVTFTVEALTTSTMLSVGQSIELSAKTSLDKNETKRLWAIIKPPKVSLVLDSYGTPILAFPRVRLYEKDGIWAATWQDFAYNGNYEISFYAEDKAGNISSSDAITVSVSGGIDSPENSSVNITLAKDRYQRGELLKAELTEELGWGYDLYAAVLLPDGNFFALRDTNKVADLNKAEKWVSDRTAHSPVTLFELNLPENLPTGQYCFYGILSPERENVLETVPLWVMSQRCFEVF